MDDPPLLDIPGSTYGSLDGVMQGIHATKRKQKQKETTARSELAPRRKGRSEKRRHADKATSSPTLQPAEPAARKEEKQRAELFVPPALEERGSKFGG